MKGFKQGAQTHPGLAEAGAAMGFAKGGQVKKDVSSNFKMTTKQADTMDHGNMPATEGDSEQEKEAGGRKRVRPGYKEGGKVEGYTRCNMGGKVCYKKGGKVYMMKGGKMVPYSTHKRADNYRTGDPGGGKAAKKNAGKGVVKKARGGRIHKTHGMPDRSQGEGVKASGRGSKNVGKGGEVGAHKYTHDGKSSGK